MKQKETSEDRHLSCPISSEMGWERNVGNVSATSFNKN